MRRALLRHRFAAGTFRRRSEPAPLRPRLQHAELPFSRQCCRVSIQAARTRRPRPGDLLSRSHGAGRKMSRPAAKKAFTLADHEAATAGVECRKDAGVLDETPGAYRRSTT